MAASSGGKRAAKPSTHIYSPDGFAANRHLSGDDGGYLGGDSNRKADSEKGSVDSSCRRSRRSDDRALVRAVLAAYVVEHRHAVHIVSRVRYLEALSDS